MSKSPGVLPADEVIRKFNLDLKNRAFAAVLAWLIPGAGHLYQRRTAKGVLLMVCITTTFAFGFYLGGGKVAYATPMTAEDYTGGSGRARFQQMIDRWPFLGQAGIGTVAIPAIIERQRYLANKPELFGGWFRPPLKAGMQIEPSKDSSENLVYHPNELAKWNYEKGFAYELGTIYTVIAGLLNVLAIFDAYSGPLVPAPVPEKAKGDNNKSDNKNPSKDKPAEGE